MRGRRERGVVLFISLIVLVSMSLAGIALMRSVDSGLLVAGNLSFKRATTSAGDFGIELARQWLIDQAALANADVFFAQHQATLGYYASWSGAAAANVSAYAWNPRTHAWTDNDASDQRADSQGNTVRFVVHRMCSDIGTASPASCLTAGSGPSGSTMGGAHYMIKPLTGGTSVYYRITVRVLGPKNTVSYVQSIIL